MKRMVEGDPRGQRRIKTGGLSLNKEEEKAEESGKKEKEVEQHCKSEPERPRRRDNKERTVKFLQNTESLRRIYAQVMYFFQKNVLAQ